MYGVVLRVVFVRLFVFASDFVWLGGCLCSFLSVVVVVVCLVYWMFAFVC